MFPARGSAGSFGHTPSPMRIPNPYMPPMWRESRIPVELAGLIRSGVWRGEGVAPGNDQPVMLISGLFAGDQSMNLMAGWLKRTGHRPCRAGIAVNVDCSQRAAEKLERRLECLAEDSGQKVAIVGQSRGGSFARVLAVRRPDPRDRRARHRRNGRAHAPLVPVGRLLHLVLGALRIRLPSGRRLRLDLL